MNDLIQRLKDLATCKHDDHSVAGEAAEMLEWYDIKKKLPGVGMEFLALYEDRSVEHLRRVGKDVYFNVNTSNETNINWVIYWKRIYFP